MKILTNLILLLFVHPLFAIDNIEESSSFSLNDLNPLFQHGISIEAEYIGELWFLDNQKK